ncbi:hypothetical protein BV898_11906 [Hypsibius exemplaris]|uniref:Receptor ligand binding region domain-containing protein n=1 Tax=Hypsibius exemplaris TaxID=2072580 RepID=A0A1W0WFD9_HYPEX|nr:hypothetical protein BV898_11906 [Hypsibius exemplaris]
MLQRVARLSAGPAWFARLQILTIATLCPQVFGKETKVNNNTTLNMCSVIERGNINLVYNYRRAAAAIDMALEFANEILLPPEIQIAFHYKDGGDICAADNKAIGSAIEWVKEGVNCNIYLGPGCDRSVADLYRFAAHQEVPIIGCPAANVVGNTQLLRKNLPLLIRPAYTFTDVSRLIIRFLDMFNYTHTQ